MLFRIRAFLLSLFNKMGYGVYRLPKADNAEYAPVTPHATYCPWSKDQAFLDTFAKVRPATLINFYQCYELWNLVGQSAKLSDGDIIQVGAWRGDPVS